MFQWEGYCSLLFVISHCYGEGGQRFSIKSPLSLSFCRHIPIFLYFYGISKFYRIDICGGWSTSPKEGFAIYAPFAIFKTVVNPWAALQSVVCRLPLLKCSRSASLYTTQSNRLLGVLCHTQYNLQWKMCVYMIYSIIYSHLPYCADILYMCDFMLGTLSSWCS